VRGHPFTMVHDLLPLALRGVQCCGDRLLAIGVVARGSCEACVARVGG
jgi:hypothetical protein